MHKSLYLDDMPFIYFFPLIACGFGVEFKRPLPGPGQEDLLQFSSVSYIVLAL